MPPRGRADDGARAAAALDRLAALHPKLIDLGLDRTRDLLARLGNPHHRLPPVIHVAGTNGKGSVIALMRAMARRPGFASMSMPRRISAASTSVSGWQAR